MKRIVSVVGLVFLMALTCQAALASDLDAFKGAKGEISIAGGTAHIPVMEQASRAIMTANPDIRITVAGGGSGVGIQKVGEGLVDIGNSGRSPSDEEIAKYGLVLFPFAVDGVATVVHPGNPVASLTKEQTQKLYSGEITNWKDVGGNDAAVNLYTRDEASGTRSTYWKKLLAKGAIAVSANVVASNGAMKTAISRDPNGLGYVSIGHLDETVKAPDLDGAPVTQQTAKAGTYPVVRKLYMNTKGQPSGMVKAFVDYVTGPECTEFIKNSGYIPLR